MCGVEMVWDGWLEDGYGWMWMCVAGNVLKTGYYYYITTVTCFSCAKDANHSQMLGSPDPLVYSFPLKLIGADHGLHTSGGVQISCFSEMLTIEGLGGLVPTLKFGSEMESTLRYAKSDDDP